jgi:prepilin-type N-terminal cleavage/methylation domain-containing protein
MKQLAITRRSYPANALRRSALGFTLLELSIVIAIVSMVLAGAVTVSGNIVRRQSYSDTREKISLLQKALIDFHAANGRLPCVSPMTAPVDTATFGVEVLGGACDTNTSVPAGTWRVASGTGFVRIGAFPSRTLGLPDQAGSDEYGNRYLYAVTESHTSVSGFSNSANPGVIIVRDNATTPNTITSDASFLILSHGENGVGGFRYMNGTQPGGAVAAAPYTDDAENADPDGVFLSARFNDNDLARYFDDVIAFVPKYLLRAENVNQRSVLFTGEASAPLIPGTGPVTGRPVVAREAVSVITLPEEATVIFTSIGSAELDIAPTPPNNPLNIGVFAGTVIEPPVSPPYPSWPSFCSYNRDFEGESSRGIYFSSATCIKRMPAGTYTLKSYVRGVFDETQPHPLRPYVVENRLQYTVIR